MTLYHPSVMRYKCPICGRRTKYPLRCTICARQGLEPDRQPREKHCTYCGRHEPWMDGAPEGVLVCERCEADDDGEQPREGGCQADYEAWLERGGGR